MAAFKRYPLGSLGIVLVLLGILVAACGESRRDPGQIHVLTWDGNVNPVMERYIDRGIDTAEKSDAVAVVLRLDTPGGLDSAMRDVIQRINSSRVPVIVYVSPAGGRAASAGTFITMAGHVAAMAPNTSIGAATPVSGSGEDIEGALGRKVTNDAVAYIRGIAELRGRNADWAESAVREAAAVSANEAVELNVVDFVATSMEDLLAQSQGREVQVVDEAGNVQTVTVQTEGASLTENDTTLFEDLLYLIADPNIAFLLLSLGGLALFIEILTPGFGVGIFGAIMLILAYFALGALPTNWAGVALIALGLGLLAAEVFISGFGVFGIGGIIAIVFGGLILFSSSEPSIQVSRWLLVAIAAVIGGFALLFATALLRMRRLPPASGRESLIGARGSTLSRMEPKGRVRVQGEVWDATADDPPLEEDADVIVTRVEGLHLWVKRDPASIKLLPAATSSGDAP